MAALDENRLQVTEVLRPRPAHYIVLCRADSIGLQSQDSVPVAHRGKILVPVLADDDAISRAMHVLF
jgi:hypothetical protein